MPVDFRKSTHGNSRTEWVPTQTKWVFFPQCPVQHVHRGIYDNDNLFEEDLDDGFVASRTEFIQLRDIRRIQKDIEAETVRLHKDDGQSTLQWVEKLRADGHLLGFKSKTDPPPPGSGLAPDVFSLMVQTKWQQKMFVKHGQHILCIDGTHNVTMYENTTLTTLLVRNRWGNGIPSAAARWRASEASRGPITSTHLKAAAALLPVLLQAHGVTSSVTDASRVALSLFLRVVLAVPSTKSSNSRLLMTSLLHAPLARRANL
ncbi:hypothetical protein R3P38DRAFT_2761082 [Favolaschia claudopus]|uniref:Uncharacterized protein n=1 Tax=Favolaschia claudopus TaxID=2862362 RepID=A0AAW0DW94_9AGAR